MGNLTGDFPFVFNFCFQNQLHFEITLYICNQLRFATTKNTENSKTMEIKMTTQEDADAIVVNIKKNDFSACYKNYYSEDVIKYEPKDSSIGSVRETKGLKAVLQNATDFHAIIEKFISKEISEPLVAGNFFSFRLCQEFELKSIGYVKLNELCAYRIMNGKIVYEEYFY